MQIHFNLIILILILKLHPITIIFANFLKELIKIHFIHKMNHRLRLGSYQ